MKPRSRAGHRAPPAGRAATPAAASAFEERGAMVSRHFRQLSWNRRHEIIKYHRCLKDIKKDQPSESLASIRNSYILSKYGTEITIYNLTYTFYICMAIL